MAKQASSRDIAVLDLVDVEGVKMNGVAIVREIQGKDARIEFFRGLKTGNMMWIPLYRLSICTRVVWRMRAAKYDPRVRDAILPAEKPAAKQKLSEHKEQCLVIEWAHYSRGSYPDLKLLYAIPNGGLRHVATASRLKAEGVKPGVPDLHLPVARRGYLTLYIEMKVNNNKPTDLQSEWIENLNKAGHLAVVCQGSAEAIAKLEWYLKGRP